MPQVEVRDDGEVVEQGQILKYRFDPAITCFLWAAVDDRLAIDEHLSGVQRMDSHDGFDQRRLAGAVVAE